MVNTQLLGNSSTPFNLIDTGCKFIPSIFFRSCHQMIHKKKFAADTLKHQQYRVKWLSLPSLIPAFSLKTIELCMNMPGSCT